MTARPLKKCPECGKNALERKIGVGAGVLFKGGGFYETDYRSESYKKAAEAEKPGASEKKEAGSSEKAAGTSTPAPDTAKSPAGTKAHPATKGKARKPAG